MDGEPPQEEDFSQIPLVERSQHKNWKARLSAYTDIIAKSAKTASDTDPFFRPYVNDGPLLRKWCLDANVVAQEKGIEAVLAIVQYSGESSAKTRVDVVPGLVDKALGATRAGTKKKGAELCAMYVEVDNTGEAVVSEVLVGLDSKQPKVVAGSIACLKDLVEQFGVPTLGNIKPLLKSFTKIFGHTDKNVRAEGTSLVLALYPYLGPAILPSLAELKPVQMAEIQKSLDSLDAEGKGAGSGKPTRFTRRMQRDREAAEAPGVGEDEPAEEEAAAQIDPRDLLDPVNALSMFPTDLDERLSSTKWKDRLEVLEECNKVLSAPGNAKISDSNIDSYGSLAATLGTKCKSDANVNVVIEAAKLIEGLAKGIGKPFGRFRGVIMVGCLERLKERKTNVVEALGKALDALFTTVPLSDMVDDVLVSLKSKNPQVREGTLKFLHRSLQTTPDAPGKDQVKPMAEALVALLGDSVEPVRSSAAECLGTMMKILGERAFNPYIERVGEIQMGKVKDAFEKAEIRYKAGGAKGPVKPAVKAASLKATAPVVKKPVIKPVPNSPPIRSSAVTSAPPSPPIKASGKFDADELLDDFSAPPARAPPARFARPGAPKPVASAAAAAAAVTPAPAPKPAAPAARKPAPTASAGSSKPPVSAKAGPSKSLAVSPTEPVKYKYTREDEDAAAQAADAIPQEYHTKLADGAWKVRLEAAEEMVKWTEEGAAETTDSEILFRFLSKTPGWGEKNFQVSGKLYQVMTIMAERSPTFGKPSAAIAIGHLCEKLGDMKLKKPAGDALSMFAEKTSLAFVLAQSYEPMQKQKAPKAQADAYTWVKQQLIDFGIAGIPLRDLIAFVKTGLQSPNALVRASATQVLVTIRIFVGADISGFLEDLNPQLLTTINSEFDKVSGQTPPEPTKTSVDLQDAAPAAGGKGKGGVAGGDPLDDLIPRVDLDKLVNQTSVLTDARSDAWKTRKEAFEALNALLEVKTNSRLKPNMGEIGTVLKKAMADTNLSVKMLALGIVSKVATGMGAAFDKHSRILVGAVAGVCADQKATTRSAAIATLSAMADACGSLDSLYPGLGSSLESPNPALRASVLSWLAERLQAEPPAKGSDLTSLAAPVIHCLEDRNGDVRKGAGAILPFVVQHAGYEYVMDQTSSLKPASKATIVPLITAARGAAPSSGAAPTASTSAPPKAAAPSTSGTMNRSKVVAPSSRAPDSPKPVPAPARGIAPPGRSLAMKALASSARPVTGGEERVSALPKPRTLARPASVASQHTTASSTSGKTIPFTTSATEARPARLRRDATRWILDPQNKELPEYLMNQMEPNTAPEIFAQLFSKDHRAEEDFITGLSQLAEFYDRTAPTTFSMGEDEITGIQLANVDLALKYAALRLLSNNTQLANRCLELVGKIVETMQMANERFSDTEARLFVPALVMKLGDAKFGPKLSPIFDGLDKVIAASQVVQLLITYGLEDKSAGKTCKNESLALIEKAYRKRGSILRTKDDRGFFEILAKCISDSGTRNAALSVMALLQLQGGSSSLQAVVDAMQNSSKDMLANRRATMSVAKGLPSAPAPAISRVAETVDGTPGRLKRSGIASPISKASRDEESVEGSPAPALRGIPRTVASPTAKLTAPTPASPTTSRMAPPSAATRAIPAPTASSSRLQRPNDMFSATTNGRSMQPLRRPASSATTSPPRSNGHDRILTLINAIRYDDKDRAVNAMKQVQEDLMESPDRYRDNAQTLCEALLDTLDQAFDPPEKLRDESAVFRLVKHIINTFNGFCSNQELMRRLSYEQVYSLISALSLRLVQADRLGGLSQELVQFINMILIQALATPDRYDVFKAMFELLLNLTKDFSQKQVRAEDEVACHADLVIKCLWKRCKILDDDFASGRLQVGSLLGILEDFLREVEPAEYRRREKMGIALGDLPLRTVKTMTQRIVLYAKNHGIEIYDILLGEFGESASDTIVYSYIFRLAGPEADQPRKRTATASSSRPLSPLLPSSRPASGQSARDKMDHEDTQLANERERPRSVQLRDEAINDVPVKQETEMEALIKKVTSSNQQAAIDTLYQYIKAHPEQEDEAKKSILTILGPTVGTFIRRALDSRKDADLPSPSKRELPTSPLRSPARPESMPARAAARKSLGPRPSSLAFDDETATVDDRLARLKNVFGVSSALRPGSQSPDIVSANGSGHGSGAFQGLGGARQAKVGGGEPLSEISVQARTTGARISDVD